MKKTVREGIDGDAQNRKWKHRLKNDHNSDWSRHEQILQLMPTKAQLSQGLAWLGSVSESAGREYSIQSKVTSTKLCTVVMALF